MASIRFDQAQRWYPGADVPAVPGISLDIEDGEFMVLVGPSGCGKSTTLRMLAGLEDVNSGNIYIGDRDVTMMPPKDRDIAMVFQNYALYPHMSVRENMAFALKMAKVPGEEQDKRVAEAARILGLEEFLDRKPKALSGGQRQRVAMGRAIVRAPQVFCMDEPLSNLDAKLRVQMRAEITKLQKSLQTTTVYVTHDQIEAMTMGHRIAIMKTGQLQQVGTPLEVYERPANLFVAGFIGTPPMNLVPATLTGGKIVASGFELPWAGTGDGRKVIVGIRPENIREASRGGETAKITAKVDFVEPLGHEVIVHGRIGDDILVAKLDPHRAPEMGSDISLEIELGALHIFDAATEQRLTA